MLVKLTFDFFKASISYKDHGQPEGERPAIKETTRERGGQGEGLPRGETGRKRGSHDERVPGRESAKLKVCKAERLPWRQFAKVSLLGRETTLLKM